MNKPLRVLIVEDSEFDARLLVNMLRKGGYEPNYRRVETAEQMRSALAEQPWEIILSDYNLPMFSAPDALKTLQNSGLDIPFIIVSGGIGEDIAVASMKAGAHDYLMKGNLARLSVAVDRELREAEVRAARRQGEISLRESEHRYRLLWETAADAIVLMDTDSLIVFANPATKVVFGYEPEEIIGQKLTMLQPENLRSLHLAGLGRYLKTGVKKLNWRATETVGLRKDGTEFPIEVSFSEMEWSGARQFVGFIRDITERKRAEQELRENQEQFRVAREIQQRLFPKDAPQVPGFEIAGASQPAEATGGDYFDFLPMQGGKLGAVIGDVTGHGLGPALLMAETRAFLRLLVLNRDDVGEILTRANLALASDVDYEHYVTLLYVQLDPDARALHWANAGHTSGYVLAADGRVRLELKRSELPLGLKPATQYHTQPTVQLFPGDVILLLTDGIEEAMAPDGRLFGADRVLDVARQHRQKAAGEILQAITATVREFTKADTQEDDVTSIVIKVDSDTAPRT
ncbi:MAG TPA: SpoIIE family protein phosphatase [Verrucomicrobiae bacterium]